MVLLNGSANRDERRFPDADRFDIHRKIGHHLSFGYGIHFCLGAALARLEGRVALDEVLKRFPDWEVDYDNAVQARTSTVRGWETLPVVVELTGRHLRTDRARPTSALRGRCGLRQVSGPVRFQAVEHAGDEGRSLVVAGDDAECPFEREHLRQAGHEHEDHDRRHVAFAEAIAL